MPGKLPGFPGPAGRLIPRDTGACLLRAPRAARGEGRGAGEGRARARGRRVEHPRAIPESPGPQSPRPSGRADEEVLGVRPVPCAPSCPRRSQALPRRGAGAGCGMKLPTCSHLGTGAREEEEPSVRESACRILVLPGPCLSAENPSQLSRGSPRECSWLEFNAETCAFRRLGLYSKLCAWAERDCCAGPVGVCAGGPRRGFPASHCAAS